MALTTLLMAVSFLGGIFAAAPTPFPVGICTTGAPTSINLLSYNVSHGQTACPNLNVSTQWSITVNVTSPASGGDGRFNASISRGLCSLGRTVYTNDSLPALAGSIELITLVYISDFTTTTVHIAYAFSGIYLTSSDHITVFTSDSPPLASLWEIYGAIGTSTVLCQQDSDGHLTDAPTTVRPFDSSSRTCIYATPYVQATRLTLTTNMQPVAPGNYTLVLTNDTCTSSYLRRSPPLFYTVLPDNRATSTAAVIVYPPTASPLPTANFGPIIGGSVGSAGIALVLIMMVLAVLAIIKAKGTTPVRLTSITPTTRDTTPSSKIALLAVSKTPWLEKFSNKLAFCHTVSSCQPLVEGCTKELLFNRLEDVQCSTVYLVLNRPSDELVEAINRSSFPANTQHKLVVVQLDSNGGAGGGLHCNVTWLKPTAEMQTNAEDCAMWVHSSTSMSATNLFPRDVDAQEGNPAVTTMTTCPEVNQEVFINIASMFKDVQNNVNYLVDQKQKEKMNCSLVDPLQI